MPVKRVLARSPRACLHLGRAWLATVLSFGLISPISSLTSPLLLRLFRGALQLRHASFNVFDLDGLGAVRQHQFGGPELGGSRRVLVHHDLQHGENPRAGPLLQPRGALPERGPARLPVGLVEQGFVHPSVQRPGRDSNGACGIVYALIRQQGQHRLLLFWAQFTDIAWNTKRTNSGSMAI